MVGTQTFYFHVKPLGPVKYTYTRTRAQLILLVEVVIDLGRLKVKPQSGDIRCPTALQLTTKGVAAMCEESEVLELSEDASVCDLQRNKALGKSMEHRER